MALTKAFYKATRLDGTDFYTGTVSYTEALASGKPLKRKPVAEEYETCSDQVYHASDTPSETLIGGEWPCRLFSVTEKPVASEGHKYGFRSLRVLEELPAWQALGPNGQAVEALIERARQLTGAEAQALAAAGYAAWYAAWDAARDAAWAAAGRAARDAARHAAWYEARDAAWAAAGRAARDAARHAAGHAARDAAWAAAGRAARVAAWAAAGRAARVAAWAAARVAAWYEARYAARVAAGSEARYAARDAAGYAALALVAHDLITEDQFMALAGPWVEVIGDPR